LNNAGITCATDYMYHEELVCPPWPPFPWRSWSLV
jgi:hypothetical protein